MRIWKLILSILIIFSAILMIYPKISHILELSYALFNPEIKSTVDRLYMEMYGIALIHFVIFNMLWLVPDSVSITHEYNREM